MVTHDVDVRALSVLLSRSKSQISRFICGQFKRWDEALKADISKVTDKEVGADAFAAFELRRLNERRQVMRRVGPELRRATA